VTSSATGTLHSNSPVAGYRFSMVRVPAAVAKTLRPPIQCGSVSWNEICWPAHSRTISGEAAAGLLLSPRQARRPARHAEGRKKPTTELSIFLPLARGKKEKYHTRIDVVIYAF